MLQFTYTYISYILNSFSGFENAVSFIDFEDEDINRIENYSKSNLLRILNLTRNEYQRKHLVYLFGQFSSNPATFMFLPDERELIHAIVTHIREIVMESGKVNVNQIDHFQTCDELFEDKDSINCKLSQTSIGLIFGEDIEPNYLQSFCDAANTDKSCEDGHNTQLIHKTLHRKLMNFSEN